MVLGFLSREGRCVGYFLRIEKCIVLAHLLLVCPTCLVTVELFVGLCFDEENYVSNFVLFITLSTPADVFELLQTMIELLPSLSREIQ